MSCTVWCGVLRLVLAAVAFVVVVFLVVGNLNDCLRPDTMVDGATAAAVPAVVAQPVHSVTLHHLLLPH